LGQEKGQRDRLTTTRTETTAREEEIPVTLKRESVGKTVKGRIKKKKRAQGEGIKKSFVAGCIVKSIWLRKAAKWVSQPFLKSERKKRKGDTGERGGEGRVAGEEPKRGYRLGDRERRPEGVPNAK